MVPGDIFWNDSTRYEGRVSQVHKGARWHGECYMLSRMGFSVKEIFLLEKFRYLM